MQDAERLRKDEEDSQTSDRRSEAQGLSDGRRAKRGVRARRQALRSRKTSARVIALMQIKLPMAFIVADNPERPGQVRPSEPSSLGAPMSRPTTDVDIDIDIDIAP